MMKIAVVEDNPDNRLLVEVMLAGEYELVEYENGSDALAGMLQDPPDLALVDISLPGMDGTQLLAAMRTEPSLAGVPAIALTAHAMDGDREKYLSLGFQDYITKPIVDEAILIDGIARLLAESGDS